MADRIQDTFSQGQGNLRLMPTFVPRRFGRAGRRLRLHPDDYYALGTQRGSIKERWFASVIPAMNGPLAAPDEGMSYVLPTSGNPAEKFTLKAAADTLGAALVGETLQRQYGGWIDQALGLYAFQHPRNKQHYIYAEEGLYGKSIRYHILGLDTLRRVEGKVTLGQ